MVSWLLCLEFLFFTSENHQTVFEVIYLNHFKAMYLMEKGLHLKLQKISSYLTRRFESLKDVGYIPEGVLINHNLASPDTRCRGNHQPFVHWIDLQCCIATRTSEHLRVTIIKTFVWLNFNWCCGSSKRKQVFLKELCSSFMDRALCSLAVHQVETPGVLVQCVHRSKDALVHIFRLQTKDSSSLSVG